VPATQVFGAVQSVAWVAVVQVFAQFPAAQCPGAHDVAAGVTQVPMPLQVDTAVRENPSAHAAAAHVVPDTLAHVPPVPQSPVLVWQGIAMFGVVEHIGSAVFTGTEEQVPIEPTLLQASQAPAQAVLQQTPSAHERPVSQSVVALQVSPRACLVPPHLLFTVLHVAPTQSAFEAQVVAH
jgi:hypothetical protein